MLSKKNRADKNTIEEIFQKGTFINSPTLSFKFIKKGDVSTPKISFIVPKGIAKIATERNSLKRLGYVALREYLDMVPHGINGVFLFRKKEDSLLKIKKEIEKIIYKIN